MAACPTHYLSNNSCKHHIELLYKLEVEPTSWFVLQIFGVNHVPTPPTLPYWGATYLSCTILLRSNPSYDDLYPFSAPGSSICYIFARQIGALVHSTRWSYISQLWFSPTWIPYLLYFIYTLDGADSLPRGSHYILKFEGAYSLPRSGHLTCAFKVLIPSMRCPCPRRPDPTSRFLLLLRSWFLLKVLLSPSSWFDPRITFTLRSWFPRRVALTF